MNNIEDQYKDLNNTIKNVTLKKKKQKNMNKSAHKINPGTSVRKFISAKRLLENNNTSIVNSKKKKD